MRDTFAANQKTIAMKKCLPLLAIIALSCAKIDYDGAYDSVDYNYGRDIPHDEIVLGSRLENPYKTVNMSAAFAKLYPTKSREAVETTNLYVRFLPSDQEQFERLEELGLELTDHPLDYEIVQEGDWYRDPTLPDDALTWQYAVVSKDFEFPEDIRYELIDECFLAENAAGTRATDVDWDAVERQAYEMTGNRIATKADGDAEAAVPSGRITVVDPHYAGGKPLGVSGVRVSCNSFVKFDRCYTDQDGYYQMSKQFSSDVHYRLVFKNKKDFSIGFNFILVPASVSTLGSSGPSGVNATITQDSEEKLYDRAVVNNAVYDYITLTEEEYEGIQTPPSGLRLWIFNKIEPSSCIMMHHGTVVDYEWISSLLGSWAFLVTIFAPDITIGTAGGKEFKEIYATTLHEMAHTSHFAKVDTSYWDEYIYYILYSWFTSGSAYGDGSGERAGYCDVGESWAYFLQSKLYQERYGGSYPAFGTGYWFHPQIYRYLDERGVGPEEIIAAMDAEVTSQDDLRDGLVSLYPSKKKIIDQIFNRYN